MTSPVNARDRTQLKSYMRPLVMTLLTRMQTSKTDKYVYHFTYFLLLTTAIDVAGMGPDYVISTVEEIQPQCVALLWVSCRGLTESLGCGRRF